MSKLTFSLVLVLAFVFAALGLAQQTEPTSSVPGYVFVPSEANPVVTQQVLTIAVRRFGTACQNVNGWKWAIQRNIGQSGQDNWVAASSFSAGVSANPVVIDFRQKEIGAGSLRVSVVPATQSAGCSSPMGFLYFDLYRRGPQADPQAWYNLTFVDPSGQWQNVKGTEVITPSILRPAIGALTSYYAYQRDDWGNITNDVLAMTDKTGVVSSSLGSPFDPYRPIFVITINATTEDALAQVASSLIP